MMNVKSWKDSNYDIIVVGAGAAGLLASAFAAEAGAKVLMLEKNDMPGKKLQITGKGRCNLTNDCTVSEALENIPTGSRFLQSAFNAFSPSDTMAFFEALGVPLKTERGKRVFPVSDTASDIVAALRKNATKKGVVTICGKATGLLTEESRISGVIASIGEIGCNAVILATGGLSYPSTGSTGDGYELASNVGHAIVPQRGSLVPLVAKNDFCRKMQGLSLRNVRASVYDNNDKLVFEDFGELLFTHFGLSGPLALSASAHMREFDKKIYHILIDLKPGLDEKKLDLRLLRDFSKFKNRNFSNSLGELLNRLMIPVIVEMSKIDPDMKVHSVSREDRLRLCSIIKAFRVDITSLRPVSEAVITSGGIDLKEINPKTMESKLVRGLFFAGEIIDADAYTGGFNLQIAWSTAYAAGRSAPNCSRLTV